jgi:pyruvate dehydrogenase E2 component (dihydrolipoamide acetyltransferase)
MRAVKPVSTRPGRVIASPRARQILAQLDISPENIRGSGPNGRIVVEDLAPYLEGRAAAAPVEPRPPSAEMRRTIAQRTAESFGRVPHFYLRSEADVTALMAFRNRLKSAAAEAETCPTLTDFVLKATGQALRNHPTMNRVWQESGPVDLPGTDVGLVVSLPDGLMVPVLRNVADLSLWALAHERRRMVEAVRSGRIGAAETRGGAISVSNLGTGRVDEFAGVIYPGQCSLLAMGSAAPRPFVADGKLCVRTTVRFCLAADHRVVDGKPAADFLGQIIQGLENPESLEK